MMIGDVSMKKFQPYFSVLLVLLLTVCLMTSCQHEAKGSADTKASESPKQTTQVTETEKDTQTKESDNEQADKKDAKEKKASKKKAENKKKEKAEEKEEAAEDTSSQEQTKETVNAPEQTQKTAAAPAPTQKPNKKSSSTKKSTSKKAKSQTPKQKTKKVWVEPVYETRTVESTTGTMYCNGANSGGGCGASWHGTKESAYQSWYAHWQAYVKTRTAEEAAKGKTYVCDHIHDDCRWVPDPPTTEQVLVKKGYWKEVKE